MTETVQEPKEHWFDASPYYDTVPWFFDSWKRRHERNKNLLICSTGQSLGIGKSYWLLRAFEKADPSFTIDQVVFVPKQFWYAVDLLPSTEWHPILWDDPTRGLQKRDWYKPMNKTVTSFMKTSSRYRRKDLGFAVPAFDDLDVAVRTVMTLEAQMKEAGLAKVHRVKRNKFGNPPFWKPYLGEVKFNIPKLAKEYEKKRDLFNKEAYQAEEFNEEEKSKPESMFDKILETVKANMDRYYHPMKLPKQLSPSIIAADLHCSGEIARRVRDRIELDNRVKPMS